VNVAIINVKHVRNELTNHLARSISIGPQWWLWSWHSCIKSELWWWR